MVAQFLPGALGPVAQLHEPTVNDGICAGLKFCCTCHLVWPCLDGRILAYAANSVSNARYTVAFIAAVIQAEGRVSAGNRRFRTAVPSAHSSTSVLERNGNRRLTAALSERCHEASWSTSVPSSEDPCNAPSVGPRHHPRAAPGKVGRQSVRRVPAKPWSCRFVARSGGHAQAVFASEAEAKQFAERHAQSYLGTGTLLTWADANNTSVLITHVGEYRVTSIDN